MAFNAAAKSDIHLRNAAVARGVLVVRRAPSTLQSILSKLQTACRNRDPRIYIRSHPPSPPSRQLPTCLLRSTVLYSTFVLYEE